MSRLSRAERDRRRVTVRALHKRRVLPDACGNEGCSCAFVRADVERDLVSLARGAIA